MFDDTEILSQAALARRVDRTIRTIRNWRDRKLLPKPDLMLGGRDPAWYGRTLNSAPAFAAPADEAKVA